MSRRRAWRRAGWASPTAYRMSRDGRRVCHSARRWASVSLPMLCIRQRLRLWAIACLVFQAATLAAFVPRTCCAPHDHAAARQDPPCHEPPPADACPMEHGDGDSCPMHQPAGRPRPLLLRAARRVRRTAAVHAAGTSWHPARAGAGPRPGRGGDRRSARPRVGGQPRPPTRRPASARLIHADALRAGTRVPVSTWCHVRPDVPWKGCRS